MNMKSQAGGPTGFEELKIYDNVHHNFYRDACNARGLFNDDGEWLQCLQDAATYQIPKKFRLLFATMIRQNSPSPPFTLYQIVEFDLASNSRHQRDNLNSPYTADDFNGVKY